MLKTSRSARVPTAITPEASTPNDSLIDEVVREGARRMLAPAPEVEADSYPAELAPMSWTRSPPRKTTARPWISQARSRRRAAEDEQFPADLGEPAQRHRTDRDIPRVAAIPARAGLQIRLQACGEGITTP